LPERMSWRVWNSKEGWKTRRLPWEREKFLCSFTAISRKIRSPKVWEKYFPV